MTKEVRFHENKENSVEEIRTVVAGVQEPLVIHDLDPDKHYLFQVWWKTENEQELPQITDGGEGTCQKIYTNTRELVMKFSQVAWFSN